MATTKKPFNITAILYAAGGGVAAGVLTTALEKNVDFLADKPKVTPLIIGAVATAGIYFAPEEYAPAFYGMLGAAGGDLGMQFISERNQAKNMIIEDDSFYLPEANTENELISQNIEMPSMTKELFLNDSMSNEDFWQSEQVA